MKKLFTFITLIISVCAVSATAPCIAAAESGGREIKTIAIADGNIPGIATLYGNGENYYTDLKVRVLFKNRTGYEIELEDGYSPSIETFDFGAEDKLLFCSSQTGGSGGYGNYRVYRLRTEGYELLYDDKTDSLTKTYGAVFKPDGFMQLHDNTTDNNLTVYVGYMDKTFYNKIFNQDGNLTGEQPFVNGVSFVSPALNSASGLYRLITYRSVVAIAEVNRLGYIVNTLDFDGKAFIPSFTEFSIRL